MRCESARAMLSGWLDGELAPRRARALAAHLAHCPECQAYRNGLEADRRALRGLQAVAVPDDLKAQILRRCIDEVHERRAGGRPARLLQAVPTWSLLIAIAAGFLIARVPWSAEPAVQRAFIGEDRVTTLQDMGAPPPAFRQVGPDDTLAVPSSTAVGRVWAETASLTVEVDRIAEARRSAEAAVARLDGTVTLSSLHTDGDVQRLVLTVQVPPAHLDTLLQDLQQLGRLYASERRREDVAPAFAELDARLRDARRQEERYMELLSQAASVTEILAVEEPLARLRGEIDQLSAQRANLDLRLERSVVHVTFTAPHGQAEGRWGATSGGLAATLFHALVWGLRSLLIAIGLAAPWVLAALAARGLWRRLRGV